MATTENKTVLERIVADKERFLEILGQNSGIIAATCRSAKISRFTFYKWYKDDEEFAEKADDVKEQQKDFCEAMIFKKIKEGSDRMIIFYASCQMKDRGYSVRHEITGKDGEDLIKLPEGDLSKLSTVQRNALLVLGENTLNEEKN